MKDIKAYIAKIDAIIDSRAKTTKTDKKGLLAPSTPKTNTKEKNLDFSIVASYVESIRNARQEIVSE